jgi:3-oxoadipate enol-lactonase
LTDLHYEVTGSGPAVCLVHSGVTDSRMWDRQVALLSPDYTVLRFDLRGFGDSLPPEGPVSFVDDLHDLLDELQIDQTVLVGNSLGGRIALEYAVEHAERITKLVLVAAGLRDHDWSKEMRAFGAAEDDALARGDVDAAVELNLETWAQPHVRELVRPMQRQAFEVQLEGSDEGERPQSPPASSRLGELRTRTLVLVGDRDKQDFRALADRFAREIPRARLEVIKGAGHLPSLEQPEEFDRLLLEFLQDGV